MYLTRGWQMPFMMQAWWLFVICAVIYFVINYLTPKPDAEIIEKYTWDSPLAVLTRDKYKGAKDARLWTAILVITLIILYLIF